MPDTMPTLAEALAGLIDVAQAAGVDETVARDEGESLSATVAEGTAGAWTAWSRETGGDRTAEEFAEAASRGRRYRSAPTATLAHLAADRHPEAAAYAKALATVATSASTLGTPTRETIGKASSAAAAQLGAFAPAPQPTAPVAPPADPRSAESAAGSLDDFTKGVRGLWDDVMGQLGTLRAREEAKPSRPGSTFDLPAGADPFGPGAFPLPGTPGIPPSVPPTPGATPPADDPADPTGSTAAVATADDQTPAEPPKPVEPEKSLDEWLADLDALVGLGGVKGEIHRQVAVLRIEAKRAQAGLRTPEITRHLVFVGNPGTGKTTVARMVGGIYRALGLLSKGQLIECDRSELVAGYLGQTALKTAEVVKSAVGGVLFIDEAYSLAGDQYGTEAVDTLVKEMEDKRDDLVVIVAGYPVPMQFFIAQNPGLASRFRTTIDFADYTDDELVAIFRQIAEKADYDVSDSVEARFRELLAGVERGPSFGNGRYARNVFEAAVGQHAWRLRDVDEPTVEQMRTLEPGDLVAEASVETEPEPALLTTAEATIGDETPAEPAKEDSP